MHNFRNGKLLDIFKEYFKTFADIHTINTRDNNMRYQLPLASNKFGENTIKFRGPQIWNLLDIDIKETEKLKQFRNKFKAIYFPE